MFKKIINYFKNKKLLKELHNQKLKYKLVGIIRGEIYWTDLKRTDDISFHLFENGYGHRTYEAIGFKFSSSIKLHPIYVFDVKPWLDGLDLPGEYKV